MNCPMRLIELCFLVGKQRAEHYGRVGADVVTIDGDVAGRSAEAGIAGGKQRPQRAGRAGKAVLEIIGGIVGEHDWVIDGRVRDAQPCGKIAVLRFAGFKVNARCAGSLYAFLHSYIVFVFLRIFFTYLDIYIIYCPLLRLTANLINRVFGKI